MHHALSSDTSSSARGRNASSRISFGGASQARAGLVHERESKALSSRSALSGGESTTNTLGESAVDAGLVPVSAFLASLQRLEGLVEPLSFLAVLELEWFGTIGGCRGGCGCGCRGFAGRSGSASRCSSGTAGRSRLGVATTVATTAGTRVPDKSVKLLSIRNRRIGASGARPRRVHCVTTERDRSSWQESNQQRSIKKSRA